MLPADDTSKASNLVLLTNHFPFGNGEAFLEAEIGFHLKEFHRVIIITKNTTEPIRAHFPGITCYRFSATGNIREFLKTSVRMLLKMKSVVRLMMPEIAIIRKRRQLSFSVLGKMFHDLFKAVSRSRYIENILREQDLQGNLTLYSYWLDSSALATVFVQQKSLHLTRISRAHGGDVYSFRHPNNYLSFRKALVENLNGIFTISDDGNAFLRKSVNRELNHKIITSRLGTRPQEKEDVSLAEPFILVSCSFLLPVKRIFLLIEALSYVKLKVKWIHFGDGPLRASLENSATLLLKDKANIDYEFKGNLTNDALMNFYKTHSIHLFVNCSESEGVPVTMMEAQSFGIPIVAPEVGGIPEIVSNENGLLFHKDSSSENIATAIEKILTLPPARYQQLRDNSYQNWFSKYNADRNFPTFVAKILSIQRNEV